MSLPLKRLKNKIGAGDWRPADVVVPHRDELPGTGGLCIIRAVSTEATRRSVGSGECYLWITPRFTPYQNLDSLENSA